ncbi:sterol desaturase family protein [Sansalvadorimonas sp. 2012CJ34-2]|uniref:Sterol desaturase family protein n=1 Tax=Parendozoicomonas callyspongiae TaxID=2942213 RepID=A0ABT0PDF6_9GAMM|nr:sterol desaturase family protein [Sansalvadorimonas sp. 2012CJ34-2]MCL6269418.1 sterol desaturase family protein [Sansalvadorimonas sp. 2012CJ34-2]
MKDTHSPWLQKALPVLVFPVTMGVALLSIWQLLKADVHEGLAVFLVLVPGALIIAVLERLLPYREDWNKNDGDLKTDLIHMLVAQISIPRLTKPLWIAALVSTVGWLNQTYPSGLWPHHWPVVIQLGLVLLIAEFGRYWVHRAAHTYIPLWRFHAVHHSPNRLYWMNAGRFHPVEKVFFLIPEVVPFILLGTNIEAMSLYFVFNGIHGMFQHSNIKLKLGWLNYVFAMTELHRWHHSKLVRESNRNYGNNLIIWDLVFGTFFWPKERDVKVIGVYNPDYPKDYLGQLKAPFQGNIDKPADYKQRPKYYEAKVREECLPAEDMA